MTPRRPRLHSLLSTTMQTGRSLESSQIQDCSSGKLSKAFHTSTATVTTVRRELCFRKAKNHNNWASVSEPHTCDFNATFSLYNWGEPERAPHEREVWREDVQYLSRTLYGRRTRTRAMRDSHVGAHVSNIDTRTRTVD